MKAQASLDPQSGYTLIASDSFSKPKKNTPKISRDSLNTPKFPFAEKHLRVAQECLREVVCAKDNFLEVLYFYRIQGVS